MLKNLLQKFKQAFVKTSSNFINILTKFVHSKAIDPSILQEIEDNLLMADLGSSCTNEIISKLKSIKNTQTDNLEDIQNAILKILTTHLNVVDHQFVLKTNQLNVIMICGVNGNGKTTSAGKLAYKFKQQGYRVLLAACDTFRAAATEQLKLWGERTDCQVIAAEQILTDAASIAFKAYEIAKEAKYDILIIDTAGRLHNQKNLMDELAKIYRVINKQDQAAPHHALMVLDGTTGQNAYNQLENFMTCIKITGLIVTKLDGTAKAGVIVGLINKFKLPIPFIGIGEQTEDLQEFDTQKFAQTIIGLE